MFIDFSRDGKTELIKISSKAPPLLLILTTMAALLILQSLTVLIVQSLATALMLLVIINLGCGVWLLLVCVEQLLPTTLRLDAGGLTCLHLVTQKTYAWDDLAAFKLVSAGAVGGAARADTRDRVGVGVIQRGAATVRAGKAAVTVPPIVLIAGGSEHAEKLLDVIARIQKYQLALTAKPQERWKRAAQPQQQQQFRKRPNITMPA
jgi:hypothetical protein